MIARPVPADSEIRQHATLARVDYADAFVVTRAAHPHRSPEEWATAILDGDDSAMNRTLQRGWRMLGLRRSGGDAVAGWAVRRRDSEAILVGRTSWIGMPGELLVMRRREDVLFATFVEFRFPPARVVWRAVVATHLRIVASLLARAAT